MKPFDPAHAFHLNTMSAFEQYKIDSGDAAEPAFAHREAILVATLTRIADERLSATEMRRTAVEGLALWVHRMSPEMRERLGFPRVDESDGT